MLTWGLRSHRCSQPVNSHDEEDVESLLFGAERSARQLKCSTACGRNEETRNIGGALAPGLSPCRTSLISEAWPGRAQCSLFPIGSSRSLSRRPLLSTLRTRRRAVQGYESGTEIYRHRRLSSWLPMDLCGVWPPWPPHPDVHACV